MAESSFTGVVDSLMKGMETVLSSKTVVGEATHIGETIVIPLMDVTFGIGAGASEGSGKSDAKKDVSAGTGGLGGMTAKMTPSAVLVIKDGQTKLVNIKNQDTITKLIDLIPDLIDRFKSKDADGEEVEGLDIDVSFGKDKK